jgi:hypothetical protein
MWPELKFADLNLSSHPLSCCVHLCHVRILLAPLLNLLRFCKLHDKASEYFKSRFRCRFLEKKNIALMSLILCNVWPNNPNLIYQVFIYYNIFGYLSDIWYLEFWRYLNLWIHFNKNCRCPKWHRVQTLECSNSQWKGVYVWVHNTYMCIARSLQEFNACIDWGSIHLVVATTSCCNDN